MTEDQESRSDDEAINEPVSKDEHAKRAPEPRKRPELYNDPEWRAQNEL